MQNPSLHHHSEGFYHTIERPHADVKVQHEGIFSALAPSAAGYNWILSPLTCRNAKWYTMQKTAPYRGNPYKKEEYHELVDKYAVRKHIKSVIGEQYSFPLIGHWTRFEDIDFSTLPESFVIKCNHDSGSVRVIKNKSALTKKDIEELKKHFTKRLRRDFYYAGREYPYKGVKPCILIEKYMSDEKQEVSGLNDYKFFCFNGVPKIVLIVTDRATDCRYDFYDMDFNHLDLRYGKGRDDDKIQKPEFFDEMQEVAAKLSKGIPFVRMDLYEVGGQVYFGEYTFFDGGGFQFLKPEKWEYKMGSWINLPID